LTRVISTVFCVALLAVTVGAFALTERAKLELSPIYRTHVDKVFSPTCSCPTSAAHIDFALRKSDRLEVWMERDGKRVRTIVPGRNYRRGEVQLEFDGISDSGTTLSDGVYRPVVHLGRSHRTIRLPNEIALDTRPPVVHVRHRIYTHISPDGDGRHDTFRIRYRLGERGHGILIVDRHTTEFTRGLRTSGTLSWNGKIDGRLVTPGNHVLEISAQDAAGNRAKPFPFAVVTVRYVSLGRTRILVRPRGRFAVRVLTDSPTISWLLNRGRGTARTHTLQIGRAHV